MTGRRITVTIRYDGGATVTVRASGGLAEAIMRTVTEYDEDISRRVEALDDAKDTLVLTVTMDERGANDAITPAMVVMRVPYELWRLIAEDAEDEPPMDVWYLQRRD